MAGKRRLTARMYIEQDYRLKRRRLGRSATAADVRRLKAQKETAIRLIPITKKIRGKSAPRCVRGREWRLFKAVIKMAPIALSLRD